MTGGRQTVSGRLRGVLAAVMADSRGVTALEYAVMGAVIVVALAAAAGPIGGQIATGVGGVAALMTGTAQ